VRTRAIVLVTLLSLLPAVAAAQEAPPSPTALAISQLLTGDSFETTMAQMLKLLEPALKSMLEAELRRPPTAAEERGVLAAFRRSFEQTFPRAVFEEESARMLTRHLSEPELGELLRFYQSPVGAKMVGLNRTLMAEAERVFRSRQQQFSEHLLAELRRELGRPLR
jgi:hypothetical protein